VHTPCKLQRWSSAHSASSGPFEPSASSVPTVSDTAKCASRAACMYTRFQKCFEFQPSITPNLCGGFVCSVSPSVCLLIRDVRGRRFDFHGCQICREFFGFGAKTVFFGTKNPIRCDFPLFRLVGWLVVIWYYF